MSQVAVDLDLTAQLLCHFALEKLMLVENLDGENILALLLSRQVDVAKLATAKRHSDLEVIDAPLGAVKVLIFLLGLCSSSLCLDSLRHWTLGFAFSL